MSNLSVLIGAIYGALSVLLGAFGAHALAERLSPKYMAIFQTATHYLMFHALGLIAYGFWLKWNPQSSLLASYSFILGCVLFSGSLYALSLTEIKILGAITPLGGILFIIGWIGFAVEAWKTKS